MEGDFGYCVIKKKNLGGNLQREGAALVVKAHVPRLGYESCDDAYRSCESLALNPIVLADGPDGSIHEASY